MKELSLYLFLPSDPFAFQRNKIKKKLKENLFLCVLWLVFEYLGIPENLKGDLAKGPELPSRGNEKIPF